METTLTKIYRHITNLKSITFLLLLSILGLQACNLQPKKENSFKETSQTKTTTSNYTMVATGQTKLYDDNGNVIFNLKFGDDFYGQDGNYQTGHKMIYTDNHDGTITDKVTGLTWQAVPTAEDMSWNDAIDYCNNLKLGGHSDWRMPSVKELFSIQDFGRSWPYIDTTYFKLASGLISKDEQFWTSTKYVGVTAQGRDNSAFGVNAVTGHIKSYSAASKMPNRNENARRPPPPQNKDGRQPQNDSHPPNGNPLFKYVRAVRGAVYGTNNFVKNDDGTITDTSTELMWAQDDNGKAINWKEALLYAENASLAGCSDWRLPNVKELQSIVDYGYSTSAVDSILQKAAIDTLFTCTPITNEADKSDFGYYWTSTSAQFTKGNPYYYAWYVAFGQAVNPYGEDSHGAGAVRFDTKHKDGPAGEGGERYSNYVRLVRNLN